jgi:hypothetical protein
MSINKIAKTIKICGLSKKLCFLKAKEILKQRIIKRKSQKDINCVDAIYISKNGEVKDNSNFSLGSNVRGSLTIMEI